jgi:hypothetical protein
VHVNSEFSDQVSDHDPALREFTITSEGIVLGDEYSGPLFPAQGQA